MICGETGFEDDEEDEELVGSTGILDDELLDSSCDSDDELLPLDESLDSAEELDSLESLDLVEELDSLEEGGGPMKHWLGSPLQYQSSDSILQLKQPSPWK